MTERVRRIAIGATAMFFLGASVVTTVAVIWSLVNGNKDNNQAATQTAQQQAPQQSPLVGTKLANFAVVPSVPSLQIIDTKVGTGTAVTANSTVTVDYVGALAKTGVIFDASLKGQPASLSLSQVIKGWQEGVVGMKVGGQRRILIPAAQAYGAQSPSAAIPANSDLVFDITLDAVK